MKLYRIFIVLCFVLIWSCQTKKDKNAAVTEKPTALKWEQLFNGKDLEHWIPKIKGHPAGDNFAETFTVKDGMITVGYENYDAFDKQYGHLFYDRPFSAYFLAVEYRFTGDQAPGGEQWAWRNSGAMLHGQPAESMSTDQDFPISIEGQFLGGDGENARSTMNLCTPGTNVFISDSLYTPHCINSNSKTYNGDQWVRAGFLVLKDSLVQHYVNGAMVLAYTKPQLDMTDSITAAYAQNKGLDKPLKGGTISLQSESHPIQFRKVELINLENLYDNQEKLTQHITEILKEEQHKKTGE